VSDARCHVTIFVNTVYITEYYIMQQMDSVKAKSLSPRTEHDSIFISNSECFIFNSLKSVF
jgi:hypothetical protein